MPGACDLEGSAEMWRKEIGKMWDIEEGMRELSNWHMKIVLRT